MLTINGKPYVRDVYKEDEKWVEVQQRPYVTFIMDGLSMEFFEGLKKRSDIVVYAAELCPYKKVAGSHKDHVVCRERIANKFEDLKTAEWKAFTGVCSDGDISDEDLFCSNAMKRAKPVIFDVAASEWDPLTQRGVALDLPGMIEEVAIECDLSRLLVKPSDPTQRKEWFFAIHEDTEEKAQMIEFSAEGLNISGDEAELEERGKENVPPVDYEASKPRVTPTPRQPLQTRPEWGK